MNTYIKKIALVAVLGASAAYSMEGVCYAYEAEDALARWEALFDGTSDNDDYLDADCAVIVDSLDMVFQVFGEIEGESVVPDNFDYEAFLDRLVACATRKKVHIRDAEDDPLGVDLDGTSLEGKITGAIDIVGEYCDMDVAAYHQRIGAHQAAYPA